MASWTDEPVQFSPYRAENPVDAMLMVGITRQEQYNQGLQKVQGYMDTLGGLDVSKKEIKDYVQGKIGELYQNLNNVSGDFSDHRLISQIGGAASKIANDPIVQNGILATSTIKRGFQEIEQSKKDGKYNPSNEAYFQNFVNQWLNDGQYDTKLSASYTPYFDIVGEFQKVYKEMNDGQELPPGYIDRIIQKDPSGRTIFNLNETKNMALLEGISVDRIQSALDLVLRDSRAQQQLNIDGWAKYRGMDGSKMYDSLVQSTQSQIEKYNKAILDAQAKLPTAVGQDREALIAHINYMDNQRKMIEQKSLNYLQGLESNVEGVKKSLVEDELITDVLSAFSHQKVVTNPLWENALDLAKYELDKDWKEFEKSLKLQELLRKKQEEEDKNKPQFYPGALPVSEEQGEVGEKEYIKLMENAKQTALSNKFELLNAMAGQMQQKPLYKKDPQTGQWVKNINPNDKSGTSYLSPEDHDLVSQTALAQVNESKSKGTLPESLQELYNDWSNAEDNAKLYESKHIEIQTKYPSQQLKKSNKAAERFVPGKPTTLTFDATDPIPRFGGTSSNKISEQERVRVLNLNNEYKEALTQFQTQAAYYAAINPETKERLITRMNAALSEQSLIRKGDKTTAGEILKELSKTGADVDGRMQIVAFPQRGEDGSLSYHVGIRDGGKLKTVPINADVFRRNFPEAVINDDFHTKFGVRLQLMGGKDTRKSENEITIEQKRQSAYDANAGNFSVKYMLEQDPKRPDQYKILFWVMDKVKQEPILQYRELSHPAVPGKFSFNKAEIMEQIKNFNNEAYIKSLIESYRNR